MFKHEFRENIENRINLEEHEADLIQEMLRWMYLGEVQDMETFAPQLLPLADLVSTLLICLYQAYITQLTCKNQPL